MIHTIAGEEMCAGCSDYVASCWICTRPMRGNPDRTVGLDFYLEMGSQGKFCIHFIERYKTDSPSMYSHISIEHNWDKDDWDWNKEDPYICEDNCTTENWYSKEQVRAVVDAFMKWGVEY